MEVGAMQCAPLVCVCVVGRHMYYVQRDTYTHTQMREGRTAVCRVRLSVFITHTHPHSHPYVFLYPNAQLTFFLTFLLASSLSLSLLLSAFQNIHNIMDVSREQTNSLSKTSGWMHGWMSELRCISLSCLAAW